MTKRKKDIFNVDELIDSLFPIEKLSELFDQRVQELGITPTNALEILDIEYRALQGILYGTSKRVDITNIIKLASFLKLSRERVFNLYFKALEKKFPDSIAFPQDKIDFINANFDLATLRKADFISSITDYPQIEAKIKSHFGLKNIFEYRLPAAEVAFSAGLRQPKDALTRAFWINSAIDAFNEFDNPYEYHKQALMAYFPDIRWHSTNVEHGLINVIGDLFKLGITVFYQRTLTSLHLKGATMAVNGKPCIVITDYQGFYSTLWHTLCHELSHVLFDFDDIKKSKYHISNVNNEDLAVEEKERQADDFARGYLFAKDKTLKAKPHMNNKKFITEFAAQYQIHPSFIYTYYAYDFDKIDDKAWAKAKIQNPSFDEFIQKIENPWKDGKPTKHHVAELKKTNIYQ